MCRSNSAPHGAPWFSRSGQYWIGRDGHHQPDGEHDYENCGQESLNSTYRRAIRRQRTEFRQYADPCKTWMGTNDASARWSGVDLSLDRAAGKCPRECINGGNEVATAYTQLSSS